MLMNEIGEGKELNKLLSSFSCEMDKDIEFFYINVQLNLKNFQRRVCYRVPGTLNKLENKEKYDNSNKICI